MSSLSLTLATEAPPFLALQRQIREALRVQHPEWIRADGDCPTCDDYDRRFAQLLGFTPAMQRFRSH